MLTSKYIEKTKPKIYNKGQDSEIAGAYAGDFLSFVMGRAKSGCVWFTVMNNINVAGVAVLIDCYCIVLCEDVVPDSNLIKKCAVNNICLLSTQRPIYEACTEFSRL